jgi:hypothetical protein
MYDFMMKDLFGSKPLYQSPHIKKRMNNLDNNHKSTCSTPKYVINLNDNITK